MKDEYEIVTGIEQQAQAALEEIWAELDMAVGEPKVEKLQPGDVTYEMVMERYGWKSQEKVRAVMDPLVEAGGWVKLKVFDPSSSRQRVVYRKVEE